MFEKGCWDCGKSVDINALNCPNCGYNFEAASYVYPKCPYCKKELHIYDFYAKEVDKKGRKKYQGFKGEFTRRKKMWFCPFCGSILGFSEWNIS